MRGCVVEIGGRSSTRENGGRAAGIKVGKGEGMEARRRRG